MVSVNPSLDREEAQERAYQFIAKYAPSFQKSLGAKPRADAVPLEKLN